MMALDFVNESQPQIRWLDEQLQFLKYKSRVKGQIKDTVNEERERRLRKERENTLEWAQIPIQGETCQIYTTTLITV